MWEPSYIFRLVGSIPSPSNNLTIMYKYTTNWHFILNIRFFSLKSNHNASLL